MVMLPVLMLLSLSPIQQPVLNRRLLERVLQSHLSEVLACYELALHRDPALQGKLVVRFELGAEGDVTQAEVSSSTVDDLPLQRCVVERFRTWKFPAFRIAAQVTLPIVLQPSSW